MYTKNCFIFELINSALRTENIDALYSYRFYINDLRTCIADRDKFIRDYTSSTYMTLYHGVKQSQKDIQRLEDGIGQLISPSSFFSTSRVKEVAEMFAGVGSTRTTDDGLVSFIFEIYVDLSVHDTSVADISSFSQFKNEQEILFDLGTVFEVNAMTYSAADDVWTCYLKTSGRGKSIAQEYLELQRTKINNSDVIILFGTLLFDMGEYEKSKHYFIHLRHHMSDNFNIIFG